MTSRTGPSLRKGDPTVGHGYSVGNIPRGSAAGKMEKYLIGKTRVFSTVMQGSWNTSSKSQIDGNS